MSDTENGTETEAAAAKTAPGGRGGLFSAIVVVVLFALGGMVAWLIFQTEPTAQREGAAKQTAMLVSLTGVEAGKFRPVIHATGVVKAAQEVMLEPQVSGRVVRRGERFEPGGFVDAGEMLVALERVDYEAALEQRRSEVRQAEAALTMEMGRQRVAEGEHAMVEGSLSAQERALVLREPQLQQARAELAAARAALTRAEADLARTRIEAPFAAQVIAREVSVGSQVGPGDALGTLVGMDRYWVETSVPLAHVPWLAFPEEGQTGALVSIRQPRAWPAGVTREGRLFRLLGALEGQTRMARVLVAVEDPLARADPERPPLLIGSFVDVRIHARALEGVLRLERDYLREDDTVWLMEAGRLVIAPVEVAFRDARYAYIRSGIDADARIVTTHLATVTEGARLRLQGGTEGAGDG